MGPIITYTVNKYNKKSISKIQEEIKRRQEGSYHTYKVKEVMLNKKHYVTSRNIVAFEEINNFFSKNVSAILLKLQQEGITATGPACALYYNYDEAKGTADVAVAVPVLSPVSIKDLTSESLPDGNAAVVDYFGDYSKSEYAHYALDEYVKDRGYKLSLPVVEEYITDPLKEKDQSKWLTKIYYYATH
jgi:effector-binding domain-containing protein